MAKVHELMSLVDVFDTQLATADIAVVKQEGRLALSPSAAIRGAKAK